MLRWTTCWGRWSSCRTLRGDPCPPPLPSAPPSGDFSGVPVMGCPSATPDGCHHCVRGTPGGCTEVPEEGCPPLPVVSKGAFGPPAPKAEPKFSAADPAQSLDTRWSFPSASLLVSYPRPSSPGGPGRSLLVPVPTPGSSHCLSVFTGNLIFEVQM